MHGATSIAIANHFAVSGMSLKQYAYKYGIYSQKGNKCHQAPTRNTIEWNIYSAENIKMELMCLKRMDNIEYVILRAEVHF